jgi:hypothetical protein
MLAFDAVFVGRRTLHDLELGMRGRHLQCTRLGRSVLNERSSRQLGPGSRDTLGLLEGDEGSPFRRMDPAEGAELSLLGWT